MTDTASGDATAEAPWQRLHRHIETHRRDQGMTLADVDAAGGPSPRWVQAIRTRIGEPTHRMRLPLRQIDKALGWPDSTAWRIASGQLDEPDPVDALAVAVSQRWRALPPDERAAFEARILAVIGDARP